MTVTAVNAGRDVRQDFKTRNIWLVVGMLMTVSLGGHAAALAESSNALDRDALRADLHVLAQELPKRHAAPFHRISKRDFEKEISSLDRQLSQSGGADQAFVGMSRIVSSIGDGHTLMPNPTGAPLFGLRFAKFGRDFRLVGAAKEGAGEPALGGRLESVGGVSVDRVERLLMELTPTDETHALRDARAAGLLDRGMVLHGLGLTNDRNTVRFFFRMESGGAVAIDAKALSEEGAHWLTAARGETLWSKEADKSLSCASADAQTLYCNFRSYKGLDSAAGLMFDEIARSRAVRLIIDMRQNGGGDFCEGLKYVVRPLAARSDLNRAGRLYVLIGPETFSAAMSNSAHFRQLTRATLVGQPIGEIPNSYQEVGKLVLPNSEWLVRYSTRFYKFAFGKKNLIEPDKFIPRTWADYRSGRDSVVDWVLAQPLRDSPTDTRALSPNEMGAEESTCAAAP